MDGKVITWKQFKNKRAVEQLYSCKSKQTLRQILGVPKLNFVMISGLVHQEDKTIINKYVPNNRAPKYMKKKKTIRIERRNK